MIVASLRDIITGNREQGTGNREQGTGNREKILNLKLCAFARNEV
jgi:hypothetical protein